jgi:hypothetical protein
MANVYVFKQADIDAAATAGVTLKLSGLNVDTGDGFSDSDTLVATCAAGKKFFTNPAAAGEPAYTSINFWGWNPSEGENMYKSMTLSSGDTVATLKPTVGESYSRFEVATMAAATALTWVNHPSSGSTTDTLAFSWSGGTSPYTVVVLDPTGAEQDNASIAGTTYNFTPQHGAGTYKVSVTSGAATINQDVVIAAVLPKALYTVKQADIDAITANDIAMTVNGGAITTGTVLRLGDVVRGVVTGNRKFYTDSALHGTSINFSVFWDGEMQWQQFTLSNNDQTAEYTMVDDTSGSGGTYQAWNITTKQETPAVVGTNNVYLIDGDILAEVNKERFVTITGSDQPYDYGQFILSVLQFPFDIPAEDILGKEAIQLADRALTPTANKLANDNIKIDLGVITVPNTHNNMLDFAGTNAILHLPLAPSIVVDLEYVIGQTLGVYYVLDMYTGNATINITSTKLDGVISTTQVDIGVKVPYMAAAYVAPENTGVIAGGQNGVKVPYIELVSHDAILPDGFFTIPIVDESTIGAQSGFIKIDNVDLITSALGNEKAEIISMLSSGVIIK